MKKNFKYYALIWAILLAVWGAVTFLVRPIIPGYVVSYDGRFWTAWAFITAAFIGNLVCTYFAFKAENLKKLFLNLPLITISRSALIVMLVAGCTVMLIPNCPGWIAAVVCILVLGFNAVAVVKAAWAADTVSETEEKVKTQTAFIKNLTVDAESLIARAKSEPVKAECKKVYEAVRYSDPMSRDALASIESEITATFSKLKEVVAADNSASASEIASELIVLLDDRNKKCKLLK